MIRTHAISTLLFLVRVLSMNSVSTAGVRRKVCTPVLLGRRYKKFLRRWRWLRKLDTSIVPSIKMVVKISSLLVICLMTLRNSAFVKVRRILWGWYHLSWKMV